jgi:hypothetical protein
MNYPSKIYKYFQLAVASFSSMFIFPEEASSSLPFSGIRMTAFLFRGSQIRREGKLLL